MAMDKTQPKSAAPSQPKSKPIPVASGSLRPFLLRKRNSTQVLRCPDLTTLRQWIVEKRLTRDDEVSRSGQKWRKMGTIVEFESLFYGVDQERLAKRKATAPDGAAVIPISGAAAKPGVPSASPAKAEAKPEVKADTKAAAKTDTKPEAAAPPEKPVLGPLKVTPPGLNQVSGNLSLMRLARPGSGKAKPAPTPPGLSGSAAAAKRAHDGGKPGEAVPTAAMAGDSAPREVAKPASKPAPAASSPTTSDSQTAVFTRRPSDEVPDGDVTRRMEPSDETRRIEPSDETRRIDRDPKVTAKTKPADPIEEAIKKNDPVPRALQEARDVTQKITASEPDEYELIERQAARRRNGILLLVAGGAALGLYYLLGSDQPTNTPQTGNPPVVEQRVGDTSGTQPKPVVEPLPTNNPATATAPTATAPTATAPTATAPTATAPTATPSAAKPVPAVAPTAATPVGPAPGPTMAAKPTPPTATPVPTPAPTAAPAVAAAKPTPTVTPLPPTAAAKPPAPVAVAAPMPAVKPTPAPTPAPAAVTAPAAAGAKITSDEVRRIIDQDIPKTFDGQIELANKFFERGKYDQSLAIYQLMMTYAPNVPAIHKALGDIAFERSQADQAIAHYNDALQIRPLYSAAEFGLAKTYHRLKNDKDQAIAHYVKYLEINPKGAAAGMCRDGITKLGGTPPSPPPPGP